MLLTCYSVGIDCASRHSWQLGHSSQESSSKQLQYGTLTLCSRLMFVLHRAALQAPMVAVGEGDPGVVVATLRQALEALSRLSNERASLEEALKVPQEA